MRVLYIDIDTLRPDHMGCYGYYRNTTPNIDKVCRDGVRFDQYYCSDAPCLPSRASLISGMFGIRHGAVGHGGTAADRRLSGEKRDFRDFVDLENFINIFRKANMHTASISTFAERHSSWWFNAGFKETYNVGKGGNESGEEVLPVALDWVEKNAAKDNWFLHLHLWDPHTPYRAPDSFGEPFKDVPLDTWITEEIFDKHLQHTGPHCARELNMFVDDLEPGYPKHPGSIGNMDELKGLMDGYDTGILYADYLIGQVIDSLKNISVDGKSIYEDMAIIISSDHGENMGELGIYSEHGTADYPTCRIPMIVKWKGAASGHIDTGFHYNFDLLPTVAELLDVKKSENWDGESFKDTLLSKKDTGRDSLVLSQMAHVCQRSARFGDWLYIRTIHDGFHLFDDEMLFNVTKDPHEQNDVKEEYPDICAKGAKIILDWHDSMMKKSRYVSDPMWTVLKEGGPYHTLGELERYLIRLEETGRSAGAEALRKKYKNKFNNK